MGTAADAAVSIYSSTLYMGGVYDVFMGIAKGDVYRTSMGVLSVAFDVATGPVGAYVKVANGALKAATT